MHKHGRTASGKQRWYCPECSVSAVQTRPDITAQFRHTLFVKWLTGSRSLDEIAAEYGASRRTLIRWFKPLWAMPAPPSFPARPQGSIYVLDGVYLSGRENVALICKAFPAAIRWSFAERETAASWKGFLQNLPHPAVVVIDGQKGLSKVISQLWPEVKIQRCLVHVERLARIRLTRQPKSQAGKELLSLVHRLFDVQNGKQKRRWLALYRRWERRHDAFLIERSEGEPDPGKKRRWWYAHRNIRAARSLIRNALPNLFTYVGNPEIPRSTNHVEGGINSRIKELIHRHRGLNDEQKRVLVATFLGQIERENPTRNVT